GDVLSAAFIHSPTDIPPVNNQVALRSYCRNLAASNSGGIVSVDAIEVSGVPAFQLIYKREQWPAYIYTGMLVATVANLQYVLTAVLGEHGTTGVREAVVTAQLAEEGKLEIENFESPDASGATGRIKGWFRDPYDPQYRGIVLRSIADDERYDSMFPEHPLSR